ncbi:hypothetical protein PGTUg99_015582 [Puccinia graminis f. sp. tritici]|uniref:Uncharacterized protein n=1 Tax=Puccinia graminis f. sp. tritici TaxID=56615 RepID=A0A5B0RXC1_PUCGR|nr:hypothetical protein PGTUg99_015582 [Puccinia graminis f. sp. tritici]
MRRFASDTAEILLSGLESFKRFPNKPSDVYGTRIKHLEDVVRLLLARMEPLQPPLKDSAPLVGSFRYSIKRGLVPVLSNETSLSLTTGWRIGRSIGQVNFSSPPGRPKFGSTFKPPSLQNHSIITQSSSPDSAKSFAPGPLLSRSTTPSDPPPHCQKRPIHRASALSISSSSPALPPSRSSTTPTNSALSSSPPTRSLSTPPPPSSISASPTTSSLTDAVVSLGITKTTTVLVHSADALASTTVTQALPPVSAIVAETPASKLTLHSSVTPPSHNSQIVVADDQTQAPSQTTSFNNNSPIEVHEPLSTSSADDATATTTAILPTADQTIADLHPHSDPRSHRDFSGHQISSSPISDNMIAPSDLTTHPSPTPLRTATRPEPIPDPLPTSVHPTSQNCPDNLDVAEVVSLAVEKDDGALIETQLAPEYSSTTIEYYNNLDDYLKLSGVNETKKKKKNKKKKTTINSGSDFSTTSSPQLVDTPNTSTKLLPSPPVNEPTAAIGALSIIREEALAALERKGDPRYRPIEDSEFIGLDECNDSPTSTPNNPTSAPDNPILFYV